jgi:hypothetical protein
MTFHSLSKLISGLFSSRHPSRKLTARRIATLALPLSPPERHCIRHLLQQFFSTLLAGNVDDGFHHIED